MIATFLVLAQGLSLGGTGYGVNMPMQPPASPAGWADEFDASAINSAAWRFDTSRNRVGWFNHERQYYAADRRSNARVFHGTLIMTARREDLSRAGLPDYGGQDYTSAKLISQRSFGYGFLEVRAKLPCGRGMWPAIWLLPASGVWPDEGEIDLMEMVGWQPDLIHATLHTGAYNHRNGTQRGAERLVPTACTAFHRYELDWRPDRILIGVDGTAYMQVRNDRPGGLAAWPFVRPFHLILNLAVGGDWGGRSGIDDRKLPQRMAIDYVRFWQAG